MNKDKRNLTDTERRMLVLSEEQLYQEVEARVQIYFKPDVQFQEEAEKYSWLLKCSICKQIPFDVKQCVACEAVICESCKIRLLQGDQEMSEENQKDSPGCPCCSENPEMNLISMKNKTAQQKLDSFTETHSCCIVHPDRASYDRGIHMHQTACDDPFAPAPMEYGHNGMNFSELKKHIKEHCPLSRKCNDCQKSFDTMEEYHLHLKYSCQSVKITCSECDEQFTRREFRYHDCYQVREYRKQEICEALMMVPVGTEKQFVDIQKKADHLKLQKQYKQLVSESQKKRNQKYDDNEQLKVEHKAELSKLKKEHDAALKAVQVVTKDLQKKNKELQGEITKLSWQYAQDMQSKNDDIDELKQVIKDMKSIYNAEVEALIGENKELSKKMTMAGQLTMRESQVYVTWPESQAVRTVNYPDYATLSTKSVEELQPFQFGVNRASLCAQFGKSDVLKTGGFSGETEFQMNIDQLKLEQKIAKVKFKWVNFDNGQYDRPQWYFEFVSSDDLVVGFVNNRPGDDPEQVAQDGYELKQENDEQEFYIDENEVIISLKLGLDDYSNIVNVQFIIGKLIP